VVKAENATTHLKILKTIQAKESSDKKSVRKAYQLLLGATVQRL